MIWQQLLWYYIVLCYFHPMFGCCCNNDKLRFSDVLKLIVSDIMSISWMMVLLKGVHLVLSYLTDPRNYYMCEAPSQIF
jgi:hypothetical protein